MAALLLLGGCAGWATPADGELTPALVADALAASGGHDERAAFSAIVCPRISALGRDCGEVLRAQSTAAPPAVVPGPPAAKDRPRLIFIAGLFAECMERWVSPFKDAIEALNDQGYDARSITVAGRGTAAANAGRIAATLQAMPQDGRRAVVFAYSKGAIDILEALIRHPAATRSISAIVTIAGAQNGSHLAESRAGLYSSIVAGLPMAGCAPGTGIELVELRRDFRQAWWARNRQAINVPVFSLVALPRPDRLSPFLGIGYREVARVDSRNDGNIIWHDAIAPGGTLLGFVDADHWMVALPIERELPVLAPFFRDDVPRAILIEAALAIVMATAEATR